MKIWTTALGLFFAFASAGIAAEAPSSTQPEGPAIYGLTATSDGAVVTQTKQKEQFLVTFPASGGKPAASFLFPATNIDDRLGLAVDLKNPKRAPIRVYADLNGDTWVRGFVTVPPGKTETLYIFERRKNLGVDEVAKFPNMHGIPGGKMSLWAGITEPVIASNIKVFVVTPKQAAAVQVSNIRPFGSSTLPELTNFYPFIDKYGQYKHKDWPGKVHSDAELQANIAKENADIAAHPAPKDRDQYGGWAAGPLLTATGNFRTEKYQGKWWLVDPDGRLFWSDGLDCVGFNQSSTPTTGRETFYDDPAPNGNFLTRNLAAKYGADWPTAADQRLMGRLTNWGINTLGGGADREISALHKVPYTLQLGSGGRGAPIAPDSPAWAISLRQRMTAIAPSINNDPWCIGFFVDNEIHTSTDPAWFDSYYRQVSALAKELIPNKLYLGSRLDYHNWPDESPERVAIVRAAAKYCDVISFNFYKFTLDDVVMPDGVDKPIMVGEFHMGALDRGLFHTGLRSVVDQNQRAEGYRNYVTSALQNPAVIGAHWFQCYDESTTGRFDGEDYQIGFLDICDTPYPETIAAVRDIGARLYTIRAAKP